jgi:hypothetical protein
MSCEVESKATICVELPTHCLQRFLSHTWNTCSEIHDTTYSSIAQHNMGFHTMTFFQTLPSNLLSMFGQVLAGVFARQWGSHEHGV